MAAQIVTVTPGFDYEMVSVPTTSTTVYQTYGIDDAQTSLIHHDTMVEEHISVFNGDAFAPAPREFFAELSTRWSCHRGTSTPEIRDEWGNTAFEAKFTGLLQPECRLVSMTSGLVSYMSAPTSFFDWKNPYNIYIGGEANAVAIPYAAVIRSVSMAGIRFTFQFASGEPSFELNGNWNSRRFTLSRGTVGIAAIRRRWLSTYEYSIAAGENIPLIHLIIQILGITIARQRR